MSNNKKKAPLVGISMRIDAEMLAEIDRRAEKLSLPRNKYLNLVLAEWINGEHGLVLQEA